MDLRVLQRFRRILVLLALLLHPCAPLPGQTRAPGGKEHETAVNETVVNGQLGRALDRAVQRVTGGGYWGAVAVARGGEVLLAKGYGFADYEARPNSPGTLFELASTSKSFTAAAVLKLQMEGKLELSDPLGRHFQRVPSDKRGITILQLLTHTSGLCPDVGVPYASPFTRQQLVDYVLAQPLAARPGETFAYCNFGYALLAALVEVVSGQSFEAFSRAKLFGPAGLKETGFIRDPSLPAGRAALRLSEDQAEASASEWFWGWGYRGMGGVVSTLGDLVRWDRALRGQAVLDDKTKELFYAPLKEGYACGWLVALTPRGTTRVHHSGSVAGFAVQYVRYLEDDAVLVLLSNGRCDLGGVERAIDRLLFPAPALHALLDLEPYELSRLRAVEFADQTAWRVSADGEAVLLVLEHLKTRHAAATLRVPRPRARALAKELEKLLPRRDRRNQARMEAGLYLAPYGQGIKQLELSERLELVLMPRYTGVEQSGKEILDERITLVLLDGLRGAWPLMAKMDDRTARELLSALGKLLD